MIHRTEIQMRFCDTDALGHVNNVSFAAYAETGRLDFLGHLGKPFTSIILASVAIDFRRQVSLGDSLVIESWIAALGRSSVTLGQTLWANSERAADIKSVVVHFDYKTGKAMELPTDVRAELERLLEPGRAGTSPSRSTGTT